MSEFFGKASKIICSLKHAKTDKKVNEPRHEKILSSGLSDQDSNRPAHHSAEVS